MIILWDWASVAEHAQGSLITPAVIDKNKRSEEGRRGERQEFHWATTKKTVKSLPPPPPPIPAHHLHQPFNLLGVKIARSSSYPGREIFWGILIIVSLQLSLIQTTRSLMRSFISTSQLLCYSLALDVLPPPQAPRPPTPTKCDIDAAPPHLPPLPNPTFKDLSLKWEPLVNRLICLAALTVMAE